MITVAKLHEVAIDGQIVARFNEAQVQSLRHSIALLQGEVEAQRIMQVICEHFALRHIDLLAYRRTEQLIWPRHLAMYLIKHRTVLNLRQIAPLFGRHEHGTIINAVRSTEGRLLEHRFRRTYDAVVARLNSDNASSETATGEQKAIL